MRIRNMRDSEINDALAVERAAFGTDEEADLVRDLIADPSAQPVLSLLAVDGERAVGHILFTRAVLEPETPVSTALLAPMAVVPDCQQQGIGGALIKHGLKQLTDAGADLVFVLGWPAYYPRFGFEPAGRHGFEAMHPIAEENAGAWMVTALRPGVIGRARGRVICADALKDPKYWQE